MHEYYNCTCPDCGGYTERVALSATENGKLLKAFNKAARWAFDNKKTSISPDDLDNKNVQGLISEINNVLQDALQAGITYEIPETMLQHFNKNIYVFSGAKTYAELRELSDLLVDDKGEIKSFSKFFKDVRQVHNEYNKSYLESEYIFATQSAQMASKWVEFEQDGDEFNLQYRTANDDRVRYSHQLLHNTTLPPSDPFWLEYFPPNGWRCRCNAVQVRKKRYPESDSTTANELGKKATYTVGAGGVNTSEMFRFNPGKQNVIFPPHHPYFKNEKVVRKLEKNIESWVDVPTDKGKVKISSLHGKNEAKDNKEIARYYANNKGYEIDLIAKSENESSPDAWNKTLNRFEEYKVNQTPTISAIDNELRKAAKQADDITLMIKSEISDGDLRNAIQNRIRRTKDVKTLTVIRDGKDKTYNRDQIMRKDWEL